MPISPLYTCSRCKREFNFNSIKYDANKSLICSECHEKKQIREKKELKKEKPEDNEPINFICLSCKFKFKVKKGSQQNLKCPYCGKTKLMVVKRYKDEDDLIRDAMNPRFGH